MISLNYCILHTFSLFGVSFKTEREGEGGREERGKREIVG
jgi:hypothetical protein